MMISTNLKNKKTTIDRNNIKKMKNTIKASTDTMINILIMDIRIIIRMNIVGIRISKRRGIIRNQNNTILKTLFKEKIGIIIMIIINIELFIILGNNNSTTSEISIL